jgi:hypothetical protein
MEKALKEKHLKEALKEYGSQQITHLWNPQNCSVGTTLLRHGTTGTTPVRYGTVWYGGTTPFRQINCTGVRTQIDCTEVLNYPGALRPSSMLTRPALPFLRKLP